jgi:hypothetical protein
MDARLVDGMFQLLAREGVAHARRALGNAGDRRGTSRRSTGCDISGLPRLLWTLAVLAGVASLLADRA